MVKHYRSRRAREDVLRRVAVWGILLFLLAVSESAFFSRLHFLPATPDLVLGAVVAIALLDSVPAAAVAAVGGGIITDALGGIGAYLSPVLYLLTVLFIGGMAEKMMARVWSWLLLMLPGLCLRAGLTFLRIRLSYGGGSFLDILRGTLLPEALATVLLGLPLYFVASLCERLCKGKHGSVI